MTYPSHSPDGLTEVAVDAVWADVDPQWEAFESLAKRAELSPFAMRDVDVRRARRSVAQQLRTFPQVAALTETEEAA